ncbi:thiamine pyrophosphate-dependent enzyme [Thermodesulfobacteriota bacterium]
MYQVYMAGATSIALGLALALPHRRVISLDSDGSLLMGLSVLPVVAQQNPPNLVIIVCDNECYEPFDKLPTQTADVANLAGIAREAGIRNAIEVRELPEFQKAIDDAFKANGASFIVTKVTKSHQSGPRPHGLPYNGTENKFQFIRHIETTENRQIVRSPLVGTVSK